MLALLKERKKAEVEKKVEEAALREKEELKKKRQELFTSRRQQQQEIRQLEYKLMRMKQVGFFFTYLPYTCKDCNFKI